MFMQKQAVYGDWLQADTPNDGIVSVSTSHFTIRELIEQYDIEREDIEVIKGAWMARLSAPGYLDCTEWTGPFETEAEARAYLSDTYGDDNGEVA